MAKVTFIMISGFDKATIPYCSPMESLYAQPLLLLKTFYLLYCILEFQKHSSPLL